MAIGKTLPFAPTIASLVQGLVSDHSDWRSRFTLGGAGLELLAELL